MTTYGYGQYKKTQVSTVDSGRLIILLYDGALAFLKKAKDCWDNKDYPGLALNVNRGLDIIDELNASLNMTEGGEIADNLKRLYQFMTHHLIKARTDNNPGLISDVIKMLDQLNTAWKEAVQSQEGKETLSRRQTPLRPSTKIMTA
jgi:flagellar secretion chaperone FliS